MPKTFEEADLVRPWRMLQVAGAAMILLGSLAGVHSYAQAMATPTVTLRVTPPSQGLITTPVFDPIFLNTPMDGGQGQQGQGQQGQGQQGQGQQGQGQGQGQQGQGNGPLQPLPGDCSSAGTAQGGAEAASAFAAVTNHTRFGVLAASANSLDSRYGVSLTQQVFIPSGGSARLPLSISFQAIPQGGTAPLTVPVEFSFTWPEGQATILAQATISPACGDSAP